MGSVSQEITSYWVLHIELDISQEVQPLAYAGKPLLFSAILPPPHNSPTANLDKYWSQRYRLFSHYDDGICLDQGMSDISPATVAAVISVSDRSRDTVL